MSGTPEQGTLDTAQPPKKQAHYPRAYERPNAIALLTQINAHYSNRPVDEMQVMNFIAEIDRTVKLDEAQRAIVGFFRTHSTRDAWISVYDINRMVRSERMSRLPTAAEFSALTLSLGITDAETAWGFRRAVTYAIGKGATREKAIEYARNHCHDVRMLPPATSEAKAMTATESGHVDGVTSFAAILRETPPIQGIQNKPDTHPTASKEKTTA